MRHQIIGVAALAVGALIAVFPASAFAQHETAADLLDGERAYQASCANCHGPNGDLVPGIDLFRGRFRREMSDDDLVRTIRTGIPNTPMPATNMTAEQAAKIVAYLRSLAAKAGGGGVIAGDAGRGKAVFHGKGNCTSCHAVAGVGSRVGPDLSNVGAGRRTPDLERALLDPQSDVQPNHRFYRVVLADGTTVTGRLLGHDTFTVRMIDAQEKLRLFVKSELRSHGFAESPMPSYRNTLTPQEVADVVSYLSSLRVPQGEGRK
jgi:putative heme-binding domain-containing protein